MVNDFEYKGFEPNEEVKATAFDALDHLLPILPVGASLVARVELNGSLYLCEIDVFLSRGSVYATSSHTDPNEAIRHAEQTIVRKLARTQDTRFFTRAAIGSPLHT